MQLTQLLEQIPIFREWGNPHYLNLASSALLEQIPILNQLAETSKWGNPHYTLIDQKYTPLGLWWPHLPFTFMNWGVLPP